MWINPMSIAAFFVTLVGTLLIAIGFFLPQWWITSSESGKTTQYGLWNLITCSNESCQVKGTTQIDGGKEFLFISKVFETFGIVCSLIGLILHVLYIPFRKVLIRSVAIYCLGAAGLFVILAVFIFIGKYELLSERNKTLSVGASFAISLVGGLVCLVASAMTAYASIKKAKRHEDEERLDGVS